VGIWGREMGDGLENGSGCIEDLGITGISLVTLIKDPSFYEKTTITLSLGMDSREEQEFRIKVKQDALAVVTTGEKVTEGEQVLINKKVSPEDVQGLISHLSELCIPAVPDGLCGFDGVTYTLKIEQFMNSATYTWWVDSPEGWEGMAIARGVMMDLARKYGAELT
jgi:hypothetical protein